jgi:hypothetical protein
MRNLGAICVITNLQWMNSKKSYPAKAIVFSFINTGKTNHILDLIIFNISPQTSMTLRSVQTLVNIFQSLLH